MCRALTAKAEAAIAGYAVLNDVSVRDYQNRTLQWLQGKTFEGTAGDIFVIKAGEIHSFKAIGDSPLVQLDVHLSPRFIQENL